MRPSVVALLLLGVACGPAETPLAPDAPRVVMPEASATASAPPKVADAPATTASATASSTAAPPPSAPPARVPGLAVAARDPRNAPRASSLVAVELQNLNKLFAATSASSPDAPLIQRRIAEALVEQRKNGAEPGAKAIAAYEKLVTSFPTVTKMDEILYDLGLEYEIAGDMTKARKTYYELIRSSPSSTYVPYAYFAFGEIFLQEAKADPTKLPLAEQAHTEVIKYASSPLVPDALWRLGQIADAQGNAVKAKTMNAKLRANFPTSAAVGRIGEAL